MRDPHERGGRATRQISPRRRALAALFAAAVVLAGCAGGVRLGPQRAALSDGAVGSDAEAVFAEAYRLEQRAAFGQAVQYYNLVIDRFPGSPLVAIAEQRVAQLAGQQAVAVGEPSALGPGDYACTLEGLYAKQARWCGVVRQLRYPYFLVEVRDVQFNSWLTFWFTRSTCTGDTLLTWFSQGDQIWVPRTCLAEPRTTG
ncbi:MAG: hypothetical protein HY060_24580 [Proteobacteria bacterium]|nr:hypothetical protein [Pseudomonadota bacterium]